MKLLVRKLGSEARDSMLIERIHILAEPDEKKLNSTLKKLVSSRKFCTHHLTLTITFTEQPTTLEGRFLIGYVLPKCVESFEIELQSLVRWKPALDSFISQMSKSWSIRKTNGTLSAQEKDRALTTWTRSSIKDGVRDLRLESRPCEVDYIALRIHFNVFSMSPKQTSVGFQESIR